MKKTNQTAKILKSRLAKIYFFALVAFSCSHISAAQDSELDPSLEPSDAQITPTEDDLGSVKKTKNMQEGKRLNRVLDNDSNSDDMNFKQVESATSSDFDNTSDNGQNMWQEESHHQKKNLSTMDADDSQDLSTASGMDLSSSNLNNSDQNMNPEMQGPSQADLLFAETAS